MCLSQPYRVHPSVSRIESRVLKDRLEDIPYYTVWQIALLLFATIEKANIWRCQAIRKGSQQIEIRSVTIVPTDNT